MQTMESTSNWFYWAFLSAVFAALTAIFSKVGVAHVDSDVATLIRTLVIVVVLFAFVRASGKWTNPFELSRSAWFFLVMSALATGASWVCYFRAMKIGDASKVAAIDKLSLMMIAVFAFLFLGERPTPKNWLGIAMVVAGIVLLGMK